MSLLAYCAASGKPILPRPTTATVFTDRSIATQCKYPLSLHIHNVWQAGAANEPGTPMHLLPALPTRRGFALWFGHAAGEHAARIQAAWLRGRRGRRSGSRPKEAGA